MGKTPSCQGQGPGQAKSGGSHTEGNQKAETKRRRLGQEGPAGARSFRTPGSILKAEKSWSHGKKGEAAPFAGTLCNAVSPPHPRSRAPSLFQEFGDFPCHPKRVFYQAVTQM